MASTRHGSISLPSRGGLGLPVVIAAAVVALVVGALLGHFVIGGGAGSATFPGQTTVQEGDLDKVIGTYVYGGKAETVTVREAIEGQTTLDSVKQDDGTYTMPTADAVLAVARNRILAAEAESRGITVSDDELSSYAEKMTGESDIATIAQNYGMSEDQARQTIRESAVMYKLKDQVVSTKAGDAPTAPTTPSDGNQDTATADYWTYITGLLGDEWDSANNTWASQDGPYYAALSSETFDGKTATYAQAQKAYYVAYQQYSTNSTTSSTEWTNFVNGLLSKASISLGTLSA